MEAQHRGPFVGFLVVALSSGFLVGHALSTQTVDPLAGVVTGSGQESPSQGASTPSGRPDGRSVVVIAVPGQTPGSVVVKTIGKPPVVEAANGIAGSIIGLPTPATSKGDPDGDGLQARGDKGGKGGNAGGPDGSTGGTGGTGGTDGTGGTGGTGGTDGTTHEPPGTSHEPQGTPQKPSKPEKPAEPDDEDSDGTKPGEKPSIPGQDKSQAPHEKRSGTSRS